MASERTVMKCVTLLAEAFGRKTTGATFEVYAIALGDLTDQQVESAATIAAKRCRFMPAPAELREFAGVRTDDDRAMAAWDHVERSLSLGPYAHVDFDDRAINAAIRSLGGWVVFLARFTGAEAEKWVRQEFLRSYASWHRMGTGDEAGAILPGLAEAAIVRGKVSSPPVRFIATGLAPQNHPRIGSTKVAAPRIDGPRKIGDSVDRLDWRTKEKVAT